MGVDALDHSVGSDELTLNLDGWEGPLDLLLNLARGAEGRPRPDLDPAAGRAIYRLHRQRPGAEARDRRRLSRDGGVARLSQILPAAAQGPGAGSEPGRARASAADAASAARRDARGGRAAAGPRPDRPRRVRSRRSRGAAAGPQVGLAGHARSTCSPPMARSRRGPSPRCTSSHARSVMTLDDAIAARVGKMIGMAIDWTDARGVPAATATTRTIAARRWLRASSPRWSWRAAGGSTSTRTSRSRR